MTAPRILIDARMVCGTPHGIYQYVTRMIAGLRQMQGKAPLPYQPVFLVSEDFPREKFNGFETIAADFPFLDPREIFEIPRILKSGGFQLYHSPSFSSLGFCPCPWIVTVHDLNHLTYGGIREKLYYRWLLKPFARKAAALLTVSAFAKKELQEWLHVPDTAIEIVPNAIEKMDPPGEKSVDENLAPFGLEKKKYFFCYSNPKPHKNLLKLVQAFRYFKHHGGKQWELVLVGPRNPEFQLLENLQDPGNLGSEGLVETGPVGNEETLALLWGSVALFAPALYEGFGLPPVEAASLGMPVVASDIPPHHEGLASLKPDEVLWVKPDDRDAWVRAFHEVSRGALQPVSQQSRDAILSGFSVEKLAENMDRIYRRVLKV